jgi:hypothetical protein
MFIRALFVREEAVDMRKAIVLISMPIDTVDVFVRDSSEEQDFQSAGGRGHVTKPQTSVRLV